MKKKLRELNETLMQMILNVDASTTQHSTEKVKEEGSTKKDE